MRGRDPIVPQRRRHIPPQFSWVDHRLVRDGHLQGRSAPALALYLFLVTVSDAEGLSWYSEASLGRHLGWTVPEVRTARSELQQAGLIACRLPLCQVLDLAPTEPPRSRAGDAASVGDILRQMLGGAR
jgi:hypothetical protein